MSIFNKRKIPFFCFTFVILLIALGILFFSKFAYEPVSQTEPPQTVDKPEVTETTELQPEATTQIRNIPEKLPKKKDFFTQINVPRGKTGVILAADKKSSDWKGYNRAGTRSRQVGLNPKLLANSVFQKGAELSIELFDDARYEGTVTDSLRNVNGTISTTAKIKGSEFGRIFIASTDGEVRAHIRDTDNHKIYAIQYNHKKGTHYSLELDIALAEPDEGNDTAMAPPPDQPLADTPAEDPPPIALGDEASDQSAVIDIMFVYTDDALAAAGSTATMNNNLALAIALANDAHANTETFMVFQLVHSYELVYAEAGNMNTDLTYARTDSTIAANRTTYGADFVQFINNTGSGGIASLLQSPSGSSSIAFSVTDDDSLVSYTPVHEVGHNMGLHHASDQIPQAGPTTWSGGDPYSWGTATAGWHWHPTPAAKGYCTVMTYTSSGDFADGLGHTRIGYFSDPNYNDPNNPTHPMGNATTGFNAQVLRQLRHVYAAYRTRVSETAIQVDYPNGGEALTEGSTYNIIWDSNNVTGEVKIELYKDGSLDSVIDADTLNDRTYAWTVPGSKNGFGYSIRISDVNTGAIVDTSNATFSIDTAFYSEPLDSNPGYTTTGEWQFGVPQPTNATYYGPAYPYTGSNIYDTDIDGTSGTNGNLTSIAIDCSNYCNTRLNFYAQIAVWTDDTVAFYVSNDNTNWTQLHSESSITHAWLNYSYDISSVADYESTVYIRWSLVGGAEGNCSGLSVDDIVISGISVTPHSADNSPADWSISVAEVNSFITSYSSNSNTATTANGDITAGRITLREVMRVIYLYNDGGAYIAGQPSTVDTYDIAGVSDPPSPPPVAEDPDPAGDSEPSPTSIVVSSIADSGAGSLRNAIAMASDGDIITVNNSLDTIIILSEIVIDKSITLDGQGVAIVSGNSATRVFKVENENRNIDVVIKAIGIGDAKNSADEYGGAIYNNGQTLTLETVLFDNNTNSTEAGKGGAVYSSGALTVDGCVFNNNTASEENDVYSTNGDVTINE